MVVQHNMQAMNSNRMLNITTSAQAKSTERLSSGYKINRAADDAAGLSISEKMRKQIRGLTQASANAQDGISAVQTAEGALTEVQDMLQRMNELSVKAANGTMSESDRTAVQNEIDQLTTEIDRVAETTKFNETYLLKGDKDASKQYTYNYGTIATANKVPGSATMSTDGATSITATVAIKALKGDKLQDEQNEVLKALRDQGIKITGTADDDNATDPTYTLELSGSAADKYTVVQDGTDKKKFTIYDQDKNALMDITATITLANDADKTISATIVATDVTAVQAEDAKAKYYDKDGNAISANALGKYVSASKNDAGKITVDAKSGAPKVYDVLGNETTLITSNIKALDDLTGGLSLSLHVGADATKNNQITVNIEPMSAKGLGVNGLKVDGDDDSNALGAIDTIKEALQKVSDQRSTLGAVQNRLEHTINNLDNVVENTTSAESAIRDTDIADEMVKYSNNNILQQAGTSMLSQANQSNQLALSLLG